MTESSNPIGPRTIEEIVRDQSTWLTRLEKRIEEEKRERNVRISAFYGRRPKDLPPRLVLKSYANEKLRSKPSGGPPFRAIP